MARPLLDWLCHAPVATLLNLNVPNSDPGDVLGLRQAGLASVGGVETVVLGRDETGIDIDLVPTRRELPPGLDSTLLREGWATVSAIAPPTSLDIELPTEQWWSDR
jgi:5'-nucleotidase